ncbi:MAG: hypothetical protein ABI678_01695 [Kofleriaceae bacterium]
MAKTESTAVNNLIDLVKSNQSRSIVDPDDDLFAAPKSTKDIPPLPRTRAPSGTAQLDVRASGNPSVRMMTAPPSRGPTVPPIPQPRLPHPAPEGTPAPQRTSGAALPPPRPSTPRTRTTPVPAEAGKVTTSQPKIKSGPVASLAAVAPLTYPVVARPSAIDMTGDMVRGEDWFEASRVVEKFEDETYVGTSPHVLQDRRAGSTLAKKLILPSIGFILVGALIGGFIAFNTDGKQPASKPAAKPALPVAAPATRATPDNTARAEAVAHGANTGVPVAAAVPAPPQQVAAALPNEHEVQTTRGVVKLSDVRIDSVPSGATVTLVERSAGGEKKSFLGTTPLATSLDASHDYDVVLALAGHPEQTAHLDPARSPHLQVALAGKPAKTAPAIAKETPRPAPAVAPKHHSAVKAQLADPFDTKAAPEKPVVAEKKAEKIEKAAGGNGTLMISSKPPCEILIDGKATGMSTPQRSIPLPAGAHKITLVNAGEHIEKTLMVQINADQPTKLVKDLLAN